MLDTYNDEAAPSWLFGMSEIEYTPSRRAGMSELEEDRLRQSSIQILRDQLYVSFSTKDMNGTPGTASVFFHRFYMHHSMTEYPPRICLLACLFLAGKVEETPKKCKDLVALAQQKYPIYAADTTQDVMNVEKVLLHTLRFDLHVEHPYKFIIEYAKIFNMSNAEKGALCTTAWTFINDSYSTMLCLMWDPEIIAIVLLQMAIEVCQKQGKLPSSLSWKNSGQIKHWYDHFVSGMSQQIFVCVQHILTNFYEQGKNQVQTS